MTNIDFVAVDRNTGSLERTAGTGADYPDGSRLDGNINNALVNARNFMGGSISNVTISNVRFDARPFQLMQLQLKDHRDNFTTGIGDINNVVLQDVTMPSAPLVQSYLLDNGQGDISNVSQIRINAAGASLDDDVVIEQTDPR